MRLSRRVRQLLSEDDALAPHPASLSSPVGERAKPAPSTTTALESTQLIARLRQQIERMQRSHRTQLEPDRAELTSRPRAFKEPRVVRGAASAARDHRADARSSAARSRPLVYSRTYELAERHGEASLEPPNAENLGHIGALVALQARRDAPVRELGSGLRAEDLLFLDTETTGLSRAAGTIAFIVGVGGFWGPSGAFQVDQIVLHDPGREHEALSRLADYLCRARLWVTYNGRSFDLPVLRNRFILHRLAVDFDAPHLDLLPWCRRHFKSRLEDCRLGTVEERIVQFRRVDDLNGSEAPRVYQDYLADGRFHEMERLLEHNRHDIVTLAPLLSRLARHVLEPLEWAEDGEELLATGCFLVARSRCDLGESCLRRALELSRRPNTRKRAIVHLARLLRRQGRDEAAAALWEQYRDEFPRCNMGWIELAKHHEHHTRDLALALALTLHAPDRDEPEVSRRQARLHRRLARVPRDGMRRESRS